MTVRETVGSVAPADWKETFLWSIKVAIVSFIGALGVNATGYTNLPAVKAAAISAAGAGVSVLLNRVLSWAAAP